MKPDHNDQLPRSVEALLRLSEGYRNLGPVFDRLRERYQGYTLIPEALSSIASGLAYGYHAQSGEIFDALKSEPGWQAWSPKLKAAYDEFCAASGNEVIWIAWNYWDPTASVDNQRKIQVVTGENAALARLARSSEPFPAFTRFGLSPNTLRLAGEALHGKEDHNLVGSDDGASNRNYAEGLWEKVFSRSFSSFKADLNLLTIADFLREQFLTAKATDNPRLSPHSFLVSSDCDASVTSNLANAGEMWQWIDSLAPDDVKSGPDTLIDTWMKAARHFRDGSQSVPPNVVAIVQRFADDLKVEALDEAYVILQHILWTQQALASDYQYVLPVASGIHFCAMYFSTKVPLASLELVAWHQVAVQLFSTLIVHHLGQLVRRADQERAADEQRVVLAHTIPKFIFKPIEYFATKLAVDASRNGDSHQKIANTLLYLSSRGQAALAEYAPPPVHYESDATPSRGQLFLQADLGLICNNLHSVFDQLREFLICGYTDRGVRRRKAKLPFREELSNPLAISLQQFVPGGTLVMASSGLLTLHLWNLIDNAFRFIDFSSALKTERAELRDVLTITFRGEWVGNTAYRLRVDNTGKAIEQGPLNQLNALFSHRPEAAAFKEAAAKLLNGKEFRFPVGMEHERSGIGLRRFAEYLWMIWEDREMPELRVGEVTTSQGHSSFSFFLPITFLPSADKGIGGSV